MTVPLPSQHTSPPGGETAAPAHAMAVPRRERIAAGILMTVYGVFWGMLSNEGFWPWSFFRSMLVNAGKVVRGFRSEPFTAHCETARRGLDGLADSLILISLIFGVQSLVRCFGRHGFLPRRKFWAWTVGYSAAFLGVFGRESIYWMGPESEIYFPPSIITGFWVGAIPFGISSVMLYLTRRHE